MNFRAGNRKYRWIENWAKIPAQTGWAHHGIAVLRDGTVLTGGATRPEIFHLDPEGNVIDRLDVPVTETHGLTVSEENGEEILWIVDIGNKYGVEAPPSPQILKCTLQGKVLAKLERKDFDAEKEPFSPTDLTVDPGSGKIWIADGYGSSRVHRFSSDLHKELTLDGTNGAGRFNCPHSVFCDVRKGKTRIYIADRGNDRIQIFDADGKFLEVLDQGFVTPSAFAAFGNTLAVAELNARLLFLDADDNIMAEIGANRACLEREGWPNRLNENGEPASPQAFLEAGRFNSPHGMAADSDGNIYISEWLIGDRHIKLEAVPDA